MSANAREYCADCYLKGHYLVCFEKEKIIPLHCGRYSCPLHGWKRKKRLANGLINILNGFDRIRMMTITLSTNGFEDVEAHYRVLALAWRRFVTEIRRCKFLKQQQRDFQYAKVIDLHKSGFIHFHAFISEFISVYTCQAIWQAAVAWASGRDDLRGNIHIKGNYTSTHAARYIAKYVVKAARTLSFRLCYYSKSSKISLFPRGTNNDTWVHTNGALELYYGGTTKHLILKESVAPATDSRKKPPATVSLFPDFRYLDIKHYYPNTTTD